MSVAAGVLPGEVRDVRESGGDCWDLRVAVCCVCVVNHDCPIRNVEPEVEADATRAIRRCILLLSSAFAPIEVLMGGL